MQSGNVPSSQKDVPVRLPTLKRFITIGIMLSVSPRTQTRLMRYLSMLEADRMMVSTIKKKRSRPPAQSGRSSISCEGLVSPAFIFCPGTPREDADIVRDKLLEIGWLWTGVNTGKKSPNRLKKGHDSMFFTVVLVFVNRLRVAVRVARRQLEGASEEQVVAALAARKQHVKDVIARKVLLDGGCRTREGEATAAHHRRRRMRVDARNARRQKTIAKLRRNKADDDDQAQGKIERLLDAINKENGDTNSDSDSCDVGEDTEAVQPSYLLHGTHEVGPDFDVANMWSLVHPFLGGKTMIQHLTDLVMSYDVRDVDSGEGGAFDGGDGGTDVSEDNGDEEVDEEDGSGTEDARVLSAGAPSESANANTRREQEDARAAMRKGRMAKQSRALGVKRGGSAYSGVTAASVHGFFKKDWTD